MENVTCGILRLISESKDFILAFCAIITTAIAFMGFWTWKRQVVGTSKYQLAREFLRKLLLFQRYFKDARDNKIWEFEYPKESNQLEEFEINYFVFKKRLDIINSVFIELEYLGTEYSVLTSKMDYDILEVLRIRRNKFRTAISEYIEALENGETLRGADFYSIVFSLENDEFGNGLDNEVKKIFDEMSRYIN